MTTETTPSAVEECVMLLPTLSWFCFVETFKSKLFGGCIVFWFIEALVSISLSLSKESKKKLLFPILRD